MRTITTPACRVATLFCLVLGSTWPASALTIGLDFVTGSTTDLFGVGTTTANYSPFGFTGMNTAQIQQSILDAVIEDYLGYPTVGVSPSSPLQNGFGLNINFVLSTNTSAPLNGDLEYFFVAIGNKTGSDSFLGQACVGCVRSAGGGAWYPTGTVVGSILVDNILGLAGIASTDAQRIYLLAETIAHEIGHALSLDHPNGAQSNPGASTYSIMGTGGAPTNMPNGERILNRAFSYTEFGQLITAVGTQDTAVPEPEGLWLVGMGLIFAATFRHKQGGGTRRR